MTNLPVSGNFKITAAYGETGSMWSNGHKGIDFIASNTNVYCTCDGTVRVVGNDPDGWGRYVSVGDSKGRRHIFCHLAEGSILVSAGERINRKTIIGKMGDTGNVTGVHLHYQLNDANNQPINPSSYLGISNVRGNYSSTDFKVYADYDSISDYAKDAVDYVTQKGIMQGDGTNFNPRSYITRQDMAVIIKRISEKE